METKKYKTAVGYLRVSSASQKDGTSLESQKESIKTFCMNNNIILLNTYVDVYSGKNFKRPEFEKAHKFLKENRGDIDLFLTKKADRFTRGVKTGIEGYEDIRELGIEVNFVDEWINDIDSAQGQMIMHLKFTFAEYERATINERARLGENGAMKNGRYIKTPPNGYKWGRVNENGTLKKGIVPSEKAPLIKELFEDYATGLFTQAELVKKYKAKGLNISESSLSITLSNILYAGYIDLKKHKISPYNLQKGFHEAIISEELFYTVQDIKNGRNRMVKKIRPKNPDFPLSGFLLCACCGSPLYGSTSNNGKQKKAFHSSYRCSKNCGEKYSPEIIHEELYRVLSKAKPSKGILKLFEEVLIDEYQETLQESIKLSKSIEDRIHQIEKEQITLVDKNISGIIDDGMYLKMSEMKKSELVELKLRKNEHSASNDDLNKFLSFGLTVISNLDDFYKNATVETKVLLLGSYFTEKLIFEKNKFRTLPFNEAISLLCRYNRDFQRLQKETGADSSINSRYVPQTGLYLIYSSFFNFNFLLPKTQY
ncbi:recombinase family protein [Epilithonimonas pallida]|uniref:Site-specific DNA recombinase n=1 Tax=Epilithonimonas pallida TaxID=373671 RepID=A0ABY1RA11_9FLAO|nr:recombinase family protein [Epilithonimonas pallida]SMP96565.1 Site-specific DNA recombinase [Epilithonimonas pallida]